MFDNLELFEIYLDWQNDLLNRISLVDQESRVSSDTRIHFFTKIAVTGMLGLINLAMVLGLIDNGLRKKKGWNCRPSSMKMILGTLIGFSVSLPFSGHALLWPEAWIPGCLFVVVFLALSLHLRRRDKIRWEEHLEWKRKQLEWKRKQPVGYPDAHEFPDRSNNYGRDLQ